MNEPDDAELAATDQLIRDVLNRPLSAELELRLNTTLGRIRLHLDGSGTMVSETPANRSLWKIVVGCLAATIVLAFTGHWLTSPRLTLHEPIPVKPAIPAVPTGPPQQGPISQQLLADQAPVHVMDDSPEADYGSVTGRVVLQEGRIPAAMTLPVQGLKDVGTAPACAPSIADESLVVDPASRGIANVFVYLAKPRPVHVSLQVSSSQSVNFDGACGRFLPHALIVRTDQEVLCRSLNSFPYNVKTLSIKNAGHNVVVHGTAVPVSVSVSERLPFRVVDDMHPWMSAYWLVVDHPYAAITDMDGRFTISQLPEGDCEFHFWHESAGFLQKSLSVVIESQRKTDLGTLTADIAMFAHRAVPTAR